MVKQRPTGGPRGARSLAAATVVLAVVAVAAMLWASGDGERAAADPADPTSSPTSSPTVSPTVSPGCSVSELLVPSCGAWFGAAANPLGTESWDQALPALEGSVGRKLDIAHYYNASPRLFPTTDMIKRAREPGKKRLLLLNWKPEMGRTWAQVAAGDPTVDAVIDAEAKHLTMKFPEKFFLSIHHEPEDEVKPAADSGMTAKDYKAMYRYVVERLRAGGVTNAVYVMNYMGTPHWGSQPWFEDLYPGDDVVDWIAQDPYIFGADPEWATGLGQAVDRTQKIYPSWPGFYSWAAAKHPDKPMMLGEWGVDRKLGEEKRTAVFGGMADELGPYPQIKALVYWNETEFHPVGTTELRRDDASVAALRKVLESSRLKPPAVP